MGEKMLGLVTAQYLFIAWRYLLEMRYGMALCFVGYSLANVGLIIDSLQLKGLWIWRTT
jgi:hypothetical protein